MKNTMLKKKMPLVAATWVDALRRVRNRIALVAAAICAAASLTSFAADRTISADYVLTADETVDGVLTVDSGATVDLAGHNLTVKGLAGDGTITYPCLYKQGESLASSESIFWLDAAADETLTVDENGKVVKWVSRKGDGNYASRAASTAPSFAATACNGLPAVDFGKTGSGKDMDIATRLTTIRTVFWVLKIEKNKGAFWLGDTGNYHFHRNESGNTAGAYAATYSNFNKMWCGENEVALTDFPDDTKFIVVAGEMKSNSTSDRLTQDRGQSGRNGGKQLSELICFNRVLTADERLAVTDYLTKKWIDGDAGAYATSELHIDTSAGNVANSSVAIAGNVKLVIEGGNQFTASKANQTYFGGTEVLAGTLALGTATHPLGNGNATQTVTVGGNGILNLATYKSESTCYYNLVLDEGAVVQAGDVGDRGTGRIASITLSGNATVKLSQRTLFGGSSAAKACQLTFRGHTLTLLSLGDGNLGHVHVNDYGTFRLDANNSSTTCPGMYLCEFDLRGAKLEVTERAFVKFGNWAFYATDFVYGGLNKFTGGACNKINSVYGRYVAGNYRPPFTMQDGSTLDLSKVSGAWSSTGTAIPSSHKDVTGPGMVSFASGATINIDVGERTIAAGDRLVQFASEPSGISFTTPQSMVDANLTNVVRQIDGAWYLYVRSTEIPYARWHIDATTPANSGWKFYNAMTGAERTDWDEGITGDVEVRFSSYAEWTAIQAQNVTPYRYLMDGAVVLDGLSSIWDLNGIPIASGTTLDLNGYSVTLQSLEGFASVTDSSLDAPGELHVNTTGGNIANATTSFSGNMKLVIEGGHTFTASKANQSYTGGTEVLAGTLALGTATHPLGNGNATQTVTVGGNGILNLATYKSESTCYYNLVLDEGAVVQAGDVGDRGTGRIASITLSGNATVKLSQRTLFGGSSAAKACQLTFRGHTLTLLSLGDGNLGHVHVNDYGTFRLDANNSSTTCPGMYLCEFDLRGAKLEVTERAFVKFGNWAFYATDFVYGGLNKFTGGACNKINSVYGRYVAGNYRPPFTMQDGSTLDLSKVSGTWSAAGTAIPSSHKDVTGPGMVSFASGATVGVDLSGRTDLKELAKSATPYVVTWSSQPNATFTLDAETAERFKIKPDGTGIKLVRRSGFTIIVR